MSSGPNPIDMCTVGAAKAWIPGFQNNPAPDDTIQLLITGVSRQIVRIVGAKIDHNPDSPTYGASSLNSQITFTERYDGNGSDVLFLDNRPVRNIVSLSIDGYTPPINVGYGVYGVFVERQGYSIAWGQGYGASSGAITIGYPYAAARGRFPMGRGNVAITYLAGFGEPVPDTSPQEFTAPADLQTAALQTIAHNYVKRDRVGVKSENIQGASSTTFVDYAIPPEAALVLRMYTRVPLGSQA